MSLVGLERLGAEDVMGASWVVPSTLSSADITAGLSVIQNGLNNPVSEIDGIDPREQIRRKHVAENKETHQTTLDVHFGSDSEGEDAIPDGPLFPPNLRSRSDAIQELKDKRRKRSKRDGDKEPLDDAILEERRRAREENARARQAKIKSDLFVHDSDEESDDDADREFFEREEAVRKAQDKRVREALINRALEEDELNQNSNSKKTSRRKRSSMDEDSSDSDLDSDGQKKRRITLGGFEMSDDDDDDDILMTGVSGDQASASREMNDHTITPPTSTELEERELEKGIDQEGAVTTAAAQDSEAEKDSPVASSRRKGRAGFVIESDSE